MDRSQVGFWEQPQLPTASAVIPQHYISRQWQEDAPSAKAVPRCDTELYLHFQAAVRLQKHLLS